MTNSNRKYQPTIIACRDDKSIITHMKRVGIWEKMKGLSVAGETASILHDDELFIWHGNEGDSGYTFFKCDFPAELLLLAARALGSSLVTGSATNH